MLFSLIFAHQIPSHRSYVTLNFAPQASPAAIWSCFTQSSFNYHYTCHGLIRLARTMCLIHSCRIMLNKKCWLWAMASALVHLAIWFYHFLPEIYQISGLLISAIFSFHCLYEFIPFYNCFQFQWEKCNVILLTGWIVHSETCSWKNEQRPS